MRRALILGLLSLCSTLATGDAFAAETNTILVEVLCTAESSLYTKNFDNKTQIRIYKNFANDNSSALNLDYSLVDVSDQGGVFELKGAKVERSEGPNSEVIYAATEGKLPFLLVLNHRGIQLSYGQVSTGQNTIRNVKCNTYYNRF